MRLKKRDKKAKKAGKIEYEPAGADKRCIFGAGDAKAVLEERHCAWQVFFGNLSVSLKCFYLPASN